MSVLTRPSHVTPSGSPSSRNTHIVSTGDETSICSPILTRTPKAHTGEKPHKCRECGKAYCNPSALECHWLSHTGKKLHHCATCEKAFSKLCDLLVHERRHSGEKSYLCSKCRRAFRDAVPQCSWQEEQSVEAVPVAGKCFRLDLNFSGCTDMAGTGHQDLELMFHSRRERVGKNQEPE
ncbi:zinc finger protein 664-like isoform X2 [Dipodomys merriami]|uniref:zinc finger protein 664-like isoform X2 n=1 Tax=Dipodomys merriami TaxID=94247 RepID=UPI003855FF79